VLKQKTTIMNTTSTSSNTLGSIEALEIRGHYREGFQAILSPTAQQFLQALHLRFNPIRKNLLKARTERQQAIDRGILPDFLPETQSIREGDWKVAPVPEDLRDRRVEITGPVDRKMIINALNSGAKVFMADFEDSNSPNWDNTLQGQINLYDAIRRNIDFEHPATGKKYKLQEKTATLMVRPRGWHLEEKHILCEGECMSGSLVDFGLYFFHNAKLLWTRGQGLISICPNWKATWKPAYGTRYSSLHRIIWACLRAPSKQRS
jgi:malate synthase